MLLDDAVADRQAQARALAHRLGGEEGIEDAQQVFGRDAGAVVAHASRAPVSPSRSQLIHIAGRRFGRVGRASKAFCSRFIITCCNWPALPITVQVCAGVQCTSHRRRRPLLHPVDRALDHLVQVDRRCARRGPWPRSA